MDSESFVIDKNSKTEEKLHWKYFEQTKRLTGAEAIGGDNTTEYTDIMYRDVFAAFSMLGKYAKTVISKQIVVMLPASSFYRRYVVEHEMRTGIIVRSRVNVVLAERP